MNTLGLNTKLGFGFGSLLLNLATVAFLGYFFIGQFADTATRTDQIMVKINLTSEMQAAVEKQGTGVRGFMLAGKEDQLNREGPGRYSFESNEEQFTGNHSFHCWHRLACG
jgi:CHASE3 domain sensor protein